MRTFSLVPEVAEIGTQNVKHGAVLALGLDQLGNSRGISLNTNGELIVDMTGGNGSVPENSASTAAENSRVIKASDGTLYSLSAIQASGSDVFLHLFDATSVPSNGAVPVDWAALFSGVPGGVNYNSGRAFTTGIVAVLSSTPLSLTAIGGSIALFSARYV